MAIRPLVMSPRTRWQTDGGSRNSLSGARKNPRLEVRFEDVGCGSDWAWKDCAASPGSAFRRDCWSGRRWQRQLELAGGDWYKTDHRERLLEGQMTGRKSEITEKGLSYIPEERMKDGMIRNLNILKPCGGSITKCLFRSMGSVNGLHNESRRLIEQYRVKTPSKKTLAKSLSGGNIQKSSWRASSRAIVAAHPPWSGYRRE